MTTATALAWERETPVEVAIAEHPAFGVTRDVRLTTRRRAAYRLALRPVRAIDGPPLRLHDETKCDSCEYQDECGVRTRTLRSLLG